MWTRRRKPADLAALLAAFVVLCAAGFLVAIGVAEHDERGDVLPAALVAIVGFAVVLGSWWFARQGSDVGSRLLEIRNAVS
jgi:hypothetical protein